MLYYIIINLLQVLLFRKFIIIYSGPNKKEMSVSKDILEMIKY